MGSEPRTPLLVILALAASAAGGCGRVGYEPGGRDGRGADGPAAEGPPGIIDGPPAAALPDSAGPAPPEAPDSSAPPDTSPGADAPTKADVRPDATAASPDLAVAPTRCPSNPAILLCEDFEDQLPASSKLATEISSGGEISWSRAAFRGNGAAFLRAGAPNASNTRTAFFRKDLARPVSGGTLHVAARMFIPASATFASWGAIMTTLEGSGKNARVIFEPREEALLDFGSHRRGARPHPPRGGWFCFELTMQIAPAGAGGSVTLSIDGAPVARLDPPEGTNAADGWDFFTLGFIAAGESSGLEARIDDLVLATSRLGCL